MSGIATHWGLPEDFEPIRYPIDDEIKEVLRPLMAPDETVIVTAANEGNSITLVATNLRVMSIRSGGATAGVTGFTVRDFIYEAITDMRLQAAPLNVSIALHFQSKDNGRSAEIGQKAKFGKPATDKLMAFETNAGTMAFEAIHSVWHWKKQSAG